MLVVGNAAHGVAIWICRDDQLGLRHIYACNTNYGLHSLTSIHTMKVLGWPARCRVNLLEDRWSRYCATQFLIDAGGGVGDVSLRRYAQYVR